MRRLLLAVLTLCLVAGTAAAHVYLKGVDTEPFVPGADYDSSIPTLRDVAGHTWGERITTHGETEMYLKALAESSPRAQLVHFGETWEGRRLYYLVIATEERLAGLENIKSELRELAQPLSLSAARRKELTAKLPAVVWLAYTIHGNEPSGTDAGLWTARHLLASRGDQLVERIFEECIVVIDPLQNPDGRDRFVNYFRQTTGRWPDSDPVSAERREAWPGGRTNHYLFDMNRDWFPMTQLESRARVAAYLEWRPHVFIDLHEMGSNNTYYFPPTMPPTNRELTDRQVNWYEEFGRNNAEWFDRFGFRYYTRESFDAYYPGYGCTWPSLNGSIGMTYEQATSRGLVAEKDNETLMPYRETVRHHAIASLATADLASRNRARLLEDFAGIRTPPSTIPARRAYLIPPGPDPSRSRKLAGLLIRQGLRVGRLTGSVQLGGLRAADGGSAGRQTFGEGTWVVPARQAGYMLVRNLLEPEVPMDDEFIAEQQRRIDAGLGDQVYDITSWSLPLLMDTPCYRTDELRKSAYEEINELPALPEPMKREARLAWVLDGSTNSAMSALAELLRRGVRVYSSDRQFTHGDKKFSRGSLIVPVKNNPDTLAAIIMAAESAHGVRFQPTGSSWVSDGVNFGSPTVHFIPRPRVLLAWNEPTHSYSAGATRYVLERQYGVPVTAVRTEDIDRIEIDEYNVLILPNGWDFGDRMGEAGVKRVADWVRRGGTLVTIQGATRWLAGSGAGLLEASEEYRLDGDSTGQQKDDDGDEEEEKRHVPGTEIKSYKQFLETIEQDRPGPQAVPGAVVQLRLDQDHWLSAGYGETARMYAFGWQVYSPLKRDQGRNIAVFDSADKLLVSGHTWRGPSVRQLAFKPFLMYSSPGAGHVVAFTEDPNFRAIIDSANRLLLNAVLLGPAH
ncbi:MAG: peptidase M14 [Candidatus Glassbacteria bacterium]|nr:peptidase M14 [Candidatus Glassbacteria bacterium]